MKLRFLKSALVGSASILLANAALANEFNIPGGDLATALDAYSAQTGVELLYAAGAVKGHQTRGVKGDISADVALTRILSGTGYTTRRTASGAVGVIRESASTASRNMQAIEIAQTAPKSNFAAGIESVLVTAQKRTEDIQMVPIAVTALSSQQLNAMKIEGGPDLLKTIPNVTFSKNNFTGYNFSIRGVGTKAISATTDPGVAVDFNGTTLIQNRLFEQEYFDVERVEVLRGPQGTLYGRNATSGVINVISHKADLDEFSGSIKGEVGNFQSRRGVGMLNIPIIPDKLAVRLAGSYTSRDGYDYNSVTHDRVNGRNLWSTRFTLGFKPIEQLHGDLIWEHFNEKDNRSRTGKQLCHRDDGPQMIGGTPVVADPTNPFTVQMGPALFSQGCKPGSLYDDSAFGTPNGLALPFVFGMLALGSDCSSPASPGCAAFYPLGRDPVTGKEQTLLQLKDPYGGMMQSPNLRTIASFRDPVYRAKADVVEFNFDADLTPSLTLYSQTAYNKDQVYSFQDFNRFNTVPVFTDTSQLLGFGSDPHSDWQNLAPGGIFCDPQLGCSNTLAGFDISQAKGSQFSQEIRLQSAFSSAVNFSAGVNYTRFNTLVDYYVMYNLITAYAMMAPFNGGQTNPGPDITKCSYGGFLLDISGPLDINDPRADCPYIDPNPVESINGEGHNYFRSENPYDLHSAAAFGEMYWQILSDLKLTAGLRYTDDRKTFTLIPSQILLAPGISGGGTVNRGYPVVGTIKQHWGEFTGRLNVSWMPKIDFTDQTMIYASYSRGYKGGGANPPSPGFATLEQDAQQAKAGGFGDFVDIYESLGIIPIVKLTGAEYGPTFKPEFVNAFEIGAKNTLMGGALILNGDAFFYDYKDYQVSQIRDRTAVNENFDAKIWGAELETLFSPTSDLRFNANFGYLGTRIADGSTSIDIMDRTQSNPNYTLVKPWVQQTANCVLPTPVVATWLQAASQTADIIGGYWKLCQGGGFLNAFSTVPLIDPATGETYDPANYPELNGGAGLRAQLGGKELPNSPHFTFNIGAQYTLHWIEGWDTRVRGDFYHQASSFARVYNEKPYDQLRGWNNSNLSLTFERVDDALSIELYCKNIFDATPITDAFLNSDDTALTTNVFTLDPRLIGFSITKPF